MGDHQHGLALLPDRLHQVPGGAARLRVEAAGQFVEDDHLRIVHQRQGDEQPLPLTAGEGAEHGGTVVGQPPLMQQRLPRHGARVEGAEQVQRLPHPDPFRQRRLLQLHADPFRQSGPITDRVHSQDRDAAAVRRAQADHALDRGGLAGAVGADDPEDLALVDGEGDLVDRHHLAVPLVEPFYFDDRWHGGLSSGTAGRSRTRSCAPASCQAERGCACARRWPVPTRRWRSDRSRRPRSPA